MLGDGYKCREDEDPLDESFPLPSFPLPHPSLLPSLPPLCPLSSLPPPTLSLLRKRRRRKRYRRKEERREVPWRQWCKFSTREEIGKGREEEIKIERAPVNPQMQVFWGFGLRALCDCPQALEFPTTSNQGSKFLFGVPQTSENPPVFWMTDSPLCTLCLFFVLITVTFFKTFFFN